MHSKLTTAVFLKVRAAISDFDAAVVAIARFDIVVVVVSSVIRRRGVRNLCHAVEVLSVAALLRRSTGSPLAGRYRN